MINFKNFWLLLVITLVFACKTNSGPSFEGGMGEDAIMANESSAMQSKSGVVREFRAAAPAAAEEPVVTEPSAISRKIIRDGNMEVRVDDLQAGKNKIDALVKKYNAYYSNESFNNTEYARGYQLTIRIPADSFDVFILAIETGVGEVAYKYISSRDVTEQFIDLETRLANKRSYLTRYSELLKQAKTVKDILEIQEKTRLIEEEIESTQGRLKYLTNQVEYSTLNLQISKKLDYSKYSGSKEGNFFDRLKMSLVKGWFGLVSFLLFIIRLWPFWIITGVLIYLVRKLWKNRRRS